jgi:hypothetical protein
MTFRILAKSLLNFHDRTKRAEAFRLTWLSVFTPIAKAVL